MQAQELRAPAGARKARKRVGRGNASGHGTYSGRGIKGQKARSGRDLRVGFEGGQLSLVRRMGRKRGFTNRFRREYAPVNLAALRRFPAGAEVTPETLRAAGVVKRKLPVKVLGSGEMDRPLTVRAHRFSAAARQKIEAAGGSVIEVGSDAESSSSATATAE